MIHISIIPFSVLILGLSVAVSSKRYTYGETDEWSRCSSQCGEGEEHRVFVCLKRTPYETLESAPIEKCSKLKMINQVRKCTMGPCPTAQNGSFIWVVGNWTQCPKGCGNFALKSREVSCFLKTSDGQLLNSKLSKCNHKLEPKKFISCFNSDCSPKFLSSKWGKCPKSSTCGKSIRRRNVQCVSLLRNGKHKVIKAAFCYRLHLRPPSSWVICTPDNDKKCDNIMAAKKYHTSEVKIVTDEAQIYQMRSNKRMRLTVGQTAYIFTYSKISIVCPVEDFPQSLLKWSHNGKIYEYKGESNDRVIVNRRGVLVIKEFLLKDRGIWKCHAGISSAKATLKHELPSNGFHNWLRRHSNHNYGMFNEESKAAFIKPDSLVWMKSEWSKCSVTCGKDIDDSGFQTRRVTCEVIEAKYYKIIDDKYCTNTKPISKRRCKSTVSCPRWRIEKDNNEKCTDQCLDINRAKMNTNIYCNYETRTVDSSFCDQTQKPNVTCLNNKCALSYTYGPWSHCSLSCSNTTDLSIKSRTMHCVWNHDKRPAYNLCQHYNIYHKPLLKLCRVPKCILGCRDLTPSCQRQPKFRCRSSLFYHFCCAFCRKQHAY